MCVSRKHLWAPFGDSRVEVFDGHFQLSGCGHSVNCISCPLNLYLARRDENVVWSPAPRLYLDTGLLSLVPIVSHH